MLHAYGERKTVNVMKNHYNVLFLCTGNSARSIMAEAILNRKGKPAFTAYSAGSRPSGRVRVEALQQLEAAHMPTDSLRSKSWDEFAQPGAPEMDFVVTVCDNAAGEACPIWPGHPMTAHWGFPDPAAVEGTEGEKRAAFAQTLRQIRHRVQLFLSLPLESLDRMAIENKMRAIGQNAV